MKGNDDVSRNKQNSNFSSACSILQAEIKSGLLLLEFALRLDMTYHLFFYFPFSVEFKRKALFRLKVFSHAYAYLSKIKNVR